MYPLCCHCRRPCGARVRRGLCRSCHAVAAIRRLYPCRGMTGAPRDQDFHGPAALPEPTALPPGPDKLALLRRRVELRQALFVRGEPGTLAVNLGPLAVLLEVRR